VGLYRSYKTIKVHVPGSMLKTLFFITEIALANGTAHIKHQYRKTQILD